MRLKKQIGFAVTAVALSGMALAGCGTANTASNGGNTTGSGGSASKTTKKVTIGYDGYFEDVDVTQLWKQVLEKKGWKVTTKKLNVGALFLSMHKGGAGSVNTFLDVWMPHTHKQYMDKYGSNLEKLGVWHKGTRIGLVVPKYVYDKGIHSISDLNAHAKMFNNRIIGITPGAGEMITMKKQVIPDYHLKLNLKQGSGPSMLAALKNAEARHKPVVVTLWSPHWIFGKYQLKYLSDPKKAFGSEGVEQVEANKKWADSHPTFKKYMSKFKLNSKQLDSLGLLCQKDGTKQGVQKWMKQNQQLVNSWLS